MSSKREKLLEELKALEEQEKKVVLPVDLVAQLTDAVNRLSGEGVKEIFNQKELIIYLDTCAASFCTHKLADKIPFLAIGTKRIYKKDVVDWFLYEESLKNIEDPDLAEEFRKRFLRGRAS